MTTHKLAAQYIREQLEIIKKHGGTPRLTAEQRRDAIAETQRTFEAMQDRASSEPVHHTTRRTVHV